jgi:hypothetical protein
MQLTNSPDDKTFQFIELAVHTDRIQRYMPAANENMKAAFKYYLWNCSLCESFHLPIHFSEIVCRNAFHRGLTKRCGENWYSDKVLHTIMDERFQRDLIDVVQTEATQQRAGLTTHHIVISFLGLRSDSGSI